MEAFGLTPDDFAAEPLGIFPDNWQSVAVFSAMLTQWRVGARGAYGLDYNVLPEIWRRTKTPIKDRDSVFEDLRVMEDVALKEMRRQAEEQKGKQ